MWFAACFKNAGGNEELLSCQGLNVSAHPFPSGRRVLFFGGLDVFNKPLRRTADQD